MEVQVQRQIRGQVFPGVTTFLDFLCRQCHKSWTKEFWSNRGRCISSIFCFVLDSHLMSVCMLMTVVPGIQISSGVVPSINTWKIQSAHVTFLLESVPSVSISTGSAAGYYQGIILVPLALLHAFQTWSTLRRVAKVELDGEDGGGGQGGQDQDGEGKHLLAFYFFSFFLPTERRSFSFLWPKQRQRHL